MEPRGKCSHIGVRDVVKVQVWEDGEGCGGAANDTAALSDGGLHPVAHVPVLPLERAGEARRQLALEGVGVAAGGEVRLVVTATLILET